jgi:hypothetical protein
MAATDVAPIAAHIVSLIEALDDIGRVHAHDLWSRDLEPLLVSEISGVRTMRAWWVVGPTLVDPSYLTHAQPANAIRRPWLWRIGGIEGLDANDVEAVETMRTNMVRVIDALDADRNMGGTAHRVDPCRLTEPVQLRIIDGWACAYVEIEKVVYTVSSP